MAIIKFIGGWIWAKITGVGEEVTCSFCSAEFEGSCKSYGLHVRHLHDSYCRYVFEDKIEQQRLRAVRAESTIAQLVPQFIRPEGVYGQ